MTFFIGSESTTLLNIDMPPAAPPAAPQPADDTFGEFLQRAREEQSSATETSEASSPPPSPDAAAPSPKSKQSATPADDETSGPDDEQNPEDEAAHDDSLLATEALAVAPVVEPLNVAAEGLAVDTLTNPVAQPAAITPSETGSDPKGMNLPAQGLPGDTPTQPPVNAESGNSPANADALQTTDQQNPQWIAPIAVDQSVENPLSAAATAQAVTEQATQSAQQSSETSAAQNDGQAETAPQAGSADGDVPAVPETAAPQDETHAGRRRNAAREEVAASARSAPDVGPVPSTTDSAEDALPDSATDTRVESAASDQTTVSTLSASATQGDGAATDGTHTAAEAKAERADQQTHVDRARFVERVSRAFEALGDRSGTLRLRLSPPELGSMRLEISVHDGALTARMETETQAAKSVLLENLPALKERLAQQEIRIERFDVDVMDHRSGGDQADQFSQFAESRQRSSQQGDHGETSSGISAKQPASADRLEGVLGEGTRLNVVI